MQRRQHLRLLAAALLAAPALFLVSKVAERSTIASAAAPESAKTAIEEVLSAQVKAWNKGDLKGFMDGYWNSPELTFFSGKDRRKGWQETFERYQKRYQGEGNEMGTLRFSDLDVQVLGEGSALVKGRWELKMTKETIGGLFTLIFRKTADGWKIVHDHTSG
jgi:beta-aspartyl-peptidase (threonine type)